MSLSSVIISKAVPCPHRCFLNGKNQDILVNCKALSLVESHLGACQVLLAVLMGGYPIPSQGCLCSQAHLSKCYLFLFISQWCHHFHAISGYGSIIRFDFVSGYICASPQHGGEDKPIVI